MPRKPSRKVGTLGDLVRHGHTLTLICGHCRHRSEVDLPRLIEACSDDYLLRRLCDRAVCSACGDRESEVGVTISTAGSPPFAYPPSIGGVTE